ncbi:DUF6762 family protein [[Clostridium] colinum]|uniref:DUF6762 family protein n=1 Tax=[Clostridium] colinum TaxID=36835 RepID=UPI0020259430|nr:DUF6762 family protein [[Clostridium] colinum]
MQKNKKTGLFEKELQTLSIEKYEQFILNIYALENEDNKIFLNIKLTTDIDVLDWEYNAIYDYYDMDIFKNLGYEIIECEDEYNPTWEISFEYTEDNKQLVEKVNSILEYHNKELNEIKNIIKDKEGEYKNEK